MINMVDTPLLISKGESSVFTLLSLLPPHTLREFCADLPQQPPTTIAYKILTKVMYECPALAVLPLKAYVQVWPLPIPLQRIYLNVVHILVFIA